MAKKIDFNEVVDIKSLEDFKNVLSTLEIQLKSIIELSSKSVSGGGKINTSAEIKQTTEAVKAATVAQEELTEVQKQQIAVNLKLQELKKAEKDRIQAETSAYKQLSQEYTKAAKEAKDLAAAYGVNSKEAKDAIANAKELNDRLKSIDASMGNHQRNVGNYGDAIKGLGSKFLGWASAIGVTTGAIDIFKGIINSTQATADKFEITVGGLKEATSFFGRSIANLDFTNLIQGFKDAYKAGKDYAAKLDEIQDRNIALGLQKKTYELEIAQQKLIAKDRTRDLEERKKAVNEIIRLEKLKYTRTKEEADIAAENELDLAAKRSGLSKQTVRELLTNYNIYTDILAKASDLDEKIRAKSYETYVSRNGVISQVFSNVKYQQNLKQLTADQQTYIRWATGYNLIVDEQRKKLRESLGAQTDANKEYTEGMATVVKMTNKLLFEEEKVEAKQEKMLKNSLTRYEIIQQNIKRIQDNLLDIAAKGGIPTEKQLKELKDWQLELEAVEIRAKGVQKIELKQIETSKATDIDQIKKSKSDLVKQAEEDEKQRKKEADALNEYLKFREESVNKGLTLINSIEQKYHDDKMRRIEQELEASKRRQDTLRSLAAQGSEDAKNNLAFEEQQQIKLQALREKQEKAKARMEFAMSILKAYNSNLNNPDPNISGKALQKTLTDAAILQAFIKSLPSFKDGVWKTKKGDLDKDGGHLAVLHKNEAVLTEEEMNPVRKAGINSAPELINLALMSKKGLEITKSQQPNELSNKLDTLIQITKEKPVYLGSEFDKDNGALVERVQYGTQLVTNHRQASKLNG